MMLMVAFMFSPNIIAQTITSVNSLLLSKKECEVWVKRTSISITGNNSKTYTLVEKDGKFSTYKFIFKKTDGRAKATFTVYIDGIQHREWVFEGTIPTGENIITLTNIEGKKVSLKVKNHSATNKIAGTCESYAATNSMLGFGDFSFASNETYTEKITDTFEARLNIPCNSKGTIEITRLAGTSSAEIVVSQGNAVIKTQNISSTEPLKRFIINNVDDNTNSGVLKLTIRNIQTGQFIRAKIGAWFN